MKQNNRTAHSPKAITLTHLQSNEKSPQYPRLRSCIRSVTLFGLLFVTSVIVFELLWGHPIHTFPFIGFVTVVFAGSSNAILSILP